MKVTYNTVDDSVQELVRTDLNGWAFIKYDGFVFRGVYQPIFDRAGYIVAYEGLARITDMNGAAISPEEYLRPIRQDHKSLLLFFLITGKIHFINFSKFFSDNVSLFVNAPPSVFNTLGNISGAIEQLLIRLKILGIPQENVVYEIMEDSNSEMSLMAQGIENLKQVNIRVALDDFGSMHCDMARVKRQQVDIVKIDKTLIQNADENRAQLLEVLEYCRSRNIKTVAEGIETKEQKARMMALGVDYFQGYLTGRPISARTISIRMALSIC
ncbi:EAL domain-containing protein [Vibrio sp. S9_S30]|uniref:EAL domain-containing protein n=1 Tax=Vibrio sp. S9_S30 TaxID=2720226 RepID=UPI001680EE10|nr:EAL domain-containing protein [Vibrio sp. S9_S30]MBD1558174.1 EAL domain-containing protein [Vibrio sp. S9_S30]